MTNPYQASGDAPLGESSKSPPGPPEGELPRVLGPFDAVMLVVGSIIG